MEKALQAQKVRLQLLTTLDPDWLGNWEDEDEPKTLTIPDSLGTPELFEVLKEDPNRLSFKQYSPIVDMYFAILTLMIIAGFITALVELGIAAFLLLGSLVFAGIVRYEGRRYQTLVASRGIGGVKPFTPYAAIEWQHIEYVEIHMGEKKVNEIVF